MQFIKKSTTTVGKVNKNANRNAPRKRNHSGRKDNKKIAQLSERVIRVMGINPSVWTLDGTCTYLIGKGQSRILIDTGEGCEGYLKLLKRALHRSAATSLEAVLITHNHHDHTGGIKDLRKAFGNKLPIYIMAPPGGEVPSGMKEMKDGQIFKTIGATLQVLATPGHTEDHASFILQEEGGIFTGDAVLGEGATTFEDLDKYLASLKRMLDVPFGKTLYPGHGPVVRDVLGRLNAYMSALAVRENAILERLKRERDVKGRKGISTIRIVYKLYGDKDLLTQLAGAQVVVAHLKNLHSLGIVDFKPAFMFMPDKWTLIGDETEGFFDKSQIQASPNAIGMSVQNFFEKDAKEETIRSVAEPESVPLSEVSV